MEQVMGRAVAATAARQSLRWRVAGKYFPMVLCTVAAVLIIRNVTGGDAKASPPVTVAARHSELLAANIQFFEEHVAETRDSLSYNKLTGFYLQRLRETGDVADVRRAELSARKSLEAAPDDYAGLTNLALVRIAEHDFDSAVELSQEAIARVPTRATARAILGDAQMALGQYDAASENYRVYLEKEPGFSAFSRQAVLAEARGNLPLAEQFWKAAIDADREVAPENSAWARVHLGSFYFTTGKLQEAKSEYIASLKIYPNYPYAEAGLARVAAAEGDDTTAIRLYAKATAAVPLPEFVGALGDVEARAGRLEEARAQFALVGAMEKLFVANGVRNDLILIAFAEDHGGDALETLERARQVYEQRPSYQAADVYAWALYRAGRLDEARAKATEALRLGTKDPTLLFHAGMIAAAQQDRPAASAFLEAALDLNPRFSVLHSAEAAATLKSLRGTK